MGDTIAAISTTVGESGIGIVRLSGKDAINVGKKVFKGLNTNKEIENRKLAYGHIIDNDEIIDEVLVAFMKEPYTYTRENMLEIYCHGGVIAVKKVLELLLRSGARLADRGEFTKRAFLNGRLDLSQAEAVIDMINSKTDKSFEVSLDQLKGNLSTKVEEIMEIILAMIAHIDVSIDFPDDDIEEAAYEDLVEDANKIKFEIHALLETADRGKVLREGLNTVILGKPNVGKSSLLNSLLRENRAIVTDIPGTTRDIIEEYLNIDGIPLKIMDTAGIRDTDDEVEKIGVSRARDMVKDADLVISVFDMSEELSEDDRKIIDLIKDKKTIVLLNKMDLNIKLDRKYIEERFKKADIVESSMLEGFGLKDLEDLIRDMFYSGSLEANSDVMVTNIRHKNQLILAKENIESVINDLSLRVPMDCIEVDLKNCWNNLGEISGSTIGEDVLDRIFSEFCLGK